MSTGTEDFEKLRSLLKLKRYEQPPPGYFGRFSSQVMIRLERGEKGDGAISLVESPWFTRILRMLDTNPVMAGGLGVLVCAGLVAGIIFSQQGDSATLAAVGPSMIKTDYAEKPNEALAQYLPSDSLHPSMSVVFGTNTSGSGFNQFGAQMQPAFFTTPGN